MVYAIKCSPPGEYKANVFLISFDLPFVILFKIEEVKHHAYLNGEVGGRGKERKQKKCLTSLPILEVLAWSRPHWGKESHCNS